MTYKAPKTSRHSGQVVKKLTVYSNDSSNPTTSLTIQVKAGYEAAKFEVNPEKADFGNVLLGKKEDMKVKLKNTDSTTSNLVIIDSPYSDLVKKTKIKKLKLKPGQTTDIQFYLEKIKDIGQFNTTLTLEAEGKPGSRITIPVTGTVVAKLPEPEEKANN